MADIMSMLSGLFGGGQPQAQMPEMPAHDAPQPTLAQGLANREPVSDPLGGDVLRPGGPPPGGVMEMLKGVLGVGRPDSTVSRISQSWNDAGRHLANERAGAMDPENSALAQSVNAGAMGPQPAPGGPAATPQPLTPGAGRAIGGVTAQPMTAEFQRMFAGGGQPAPAPAVLGGGGGMGTGGGGGAPAVGGSWQTQATPAAPAVTGEDVSRFIRSVMTGAASVRPGAGKLAAFAQGAAGATQSSYAEEEKEKAAKTKASERAFDQNLKTEELGLKKNQDKRADRKEGREEGVSQARINYLEARAAAALRRDGSLDSKDISAINQNMRVWAKAKKDEGLSGAEFEKAYEEEMQRQKAQYTQKKIITPGEFRTSVAPAGGAAAGQPAAPKSQAEFDALPSGSLYVNPADGKTYKKN